MARDLLILIEAGFPDPAHPGVRFVCPDGLPVEGLLAREPALAARLDIERVPWQRPRAAVVARLGEANQSLPVLILGDEIAPPDDAQEHAGLRFVNDTRRILALLAERHGYARVH